MPGDGELDLEDVRRRLDEFLIRSPSTVWYTRLPPLPLRRVGLVRTSMELVTTEEVPSVGSVVKQRIRNLPWMREIALMRQSTMATPLSKSTEP